MSELERNCSNCKYNDCHDNNCKSNGYFFWEESEISKCNRKLDIALEALTRLGHYGIDFGYGEYTCDVAKVAQEALKEINNEK